MSAVSRLAVVVREVPIPVFTGINLIIQNITRRLAREYDVRLVVTDQAAEGGPPELPAPVIAPAADEVRRPGGGHRSAVARFYAVTLEREQWLLATLRDLRPDAVLAFGYGTAPYMAAVTEEFPVVFDLIDSDILHFLRQIGCGKVGSDNFKSLAASFLAARRYLRRCQALVTVSEEDTRNIRLVTGHRRIATVPNGVDCDFFAPRADVPVHPGRIVFSGSLSWQPNVQAIEWFLRDCWPRVRHARPDATLVIVGKNMSERQKAEFESHPGVTAVGFVPDIREHVLAAEVSIAPMVSGSGIKNKVLESWAMERAVVATSRAVAGVAARPEENILVADGARDFAAATLRVLEDGALRRALGEAGRRAALELYSWERAAAEFKRMIEEAVVQRHANAMPACGTDP